MSKTKSFKKVLSILLSVLMIITAMPFAGVTAFADNANYKAVQDAITAYETMMDGSVYTNMAPAYNAYVNANEAVKYACENNDPSKLSSAYEKLNLAINDMKKTNAPSYNAVSPTFPSTANIPSSYYSNIIYYSTGLSDISGGYAELYNYKEIGRTYRYFEGKMHMNQTVVIVLDGNNPKIPITAELRRRNEKSNRGKFKLVGIGINSSYTDKWALTGLWKGDTSTSWNGFSTSESVKINKETSYDGNCVYDFGTSGSSQRISISNSLEYRGSGNTTDYYDHLTGANQIEFDVYAQPNYNNPSSYSKLSTFYSNAENIYILNFKPVLDGYNAKKKYLSKAKEYKYGGLSSVYEALDSAINLNLNSYFSNGNNVTDAAKKIKEVVNSLNSAQASSSQTVVSHNVNSYELKSTTEPTCSEKGRKQYVCKYCGDTTTAEIAIDPDAHKFEIQNGNAVCTLCNLNITAPTVEESYMITKGNMFDFDSFADSKSSTVSKGGVSVVDKDKDSITIFGSKNDINTGTNATGDYYKIPVDSNTDYSLSYQSSFEKPLSAQVLVFYYNGNEKSKVTEHYAYYNSSNGYNTIEFTTPSDCNNIQIRFGTVSNPETERTAVTFSKIALIKDGEGEIINNNVAPNTTFESAVADFQQANGVCFGNCGIGNTEIVNSNLDVTYTVHDYVRTMPYENGFYTWKDTCSRCNDVVELGSVDANAYNAAVAEANASIANTAKYTVDSRNDLQTVVTNNTITFEKDNPIEQTEVETATTAIQSANKLTTEKGKLVLESYTLTFNVRTDDKIVTTNSKTYNYGEVVTLSVGEGILPYKWTKTVNDNDQFLAGATDSVSLVIVANTTVQAYYNEKSPVEETTQHKITVLNKYNKAISYIYVNDNTEITLNGPTISYNSSSYTIDKLPFYQITGYTINNQEVLGEYQYTVTSDITVKPVYTASKTIEIKLGTNSIKFKDDEVSTTKTAQWDEKITVVADSEMIWYVDDVAVAKGNTYTFRVSKSVTITAIPVEPATEETPNSIVNYAEFDKENNKAIITVSNYQSSNYKIAEQGIIFGTSKTANAEFNKQLIIDKGKKYVASKTTDTGDQFSFSLSFDKNTTVRTLCIVSYVKYVGQSEPVYSDTVTYVAIN